MIIMHLLLATLFIYSSPLFALYKKPTCNHIITSNSHSRIGDTMLAYSLAKRYSYEFDIPFFVTCSNDVEFFSQHHQDPILKPTRNRLFEPVEVESENQLLKILRTEKDPKLLIISHSTVPSCPGELVANFNWPDIYTSMYYLFHEYPVLYKEIKQALQLEQVFERIHIPEKHISVAVHVRKGSGPDTEPSSVQYFDEWNSILNNGIAKPTIPYATDLHFPLKLPPEQFYVDQITKLSTLLGHVPLFVYIFTDNKNPQDIIQRFKQRITAPNITFAYNDVTLADRSANKSDIINDIYNMAQFDCLIKAESGFSLISQFMGNHKIIIYPQNSKLYSVSNLNQIMIHVDDVSIIFNDPEESSPDYLQFNDITEDLQKRAFNLLLANTEKPPKLLNSEEEQTLKSPSQQNKKQQSYFLTMKDQSHTTSRLGDNVLSYCTAKWYSYKYNLPFLFSPFKHSDLFSCNKVDPNLEESPINNFTPIDITSEHELVNIIRTNNETSLLRITYGSVVRHPGELVANFHWPDVFTSIYFYTREHPAFGADLKAGLMPAFTPQPIAWPSDKITVAVHVRKGSGPDAPPVSVQYNDEWNYILENNIRKPSLIDGCDLRFPLRAPSEQYYVDQIIKLSELLDHAPLYLYIFTDDKNPQDIVERLKKRINLSNITFDYNKQNPSDRSEQQQDLIDDIYNMAQSDCLIKSQSGFSGISQLIGNHKIVIYPQNSQIYAYPPLNQLMINVHDISMILYDEKTNTASYNGFKKVTDELKNKAQALLPKEN